MTKKTIIKPKREQKGPGGRPSEYDPSFVKKVDEYLANAVDKVIAIPGTGFRTEVQLPKREGFAKYLGVTRQTLDNWSKEYPEFFDALERIDAEQKDRVINKGLSGDYNPTIAKLILSANHGMAEKSSQEISGKDGGPIDSNLTIRFVKTDGEEEA